MQHTIVLISGDGIGPEVTGAAMEVVKASGVDVQWVHCDMGTAALAKGQPVLPPETLQAIRRYKVALKGPTTTPMGKGHTSANVLLRRELDLYANIRPVKSLPGVKTPYADVDLVVVRENTQGLYKGQELDIVPGVNVAFKVVTLDGCKRISRAAFAYAATHSRKQVAVGHKSNILKRNDGMLVDSALEVAKQHPQIVFNDCLVDAMCMKLVLDPKQFDVLLLPNLYGDIVSDLCAGLVGGLGLVPGVNLGDRAAVFEAVHGSAPSLAGRNKANPTALILSAALLLHHLGEQKAACRIERAVSKILGAEDVKTADLGGTASTTDVTQAVKRCLT